MIYKDINEQIFRVENMEKRYEKSKAQITELQKALDNYENILHDLRKVLAYYDSETWTTDCEARKNGCFPNYIKTEVVSENGVYTLLADISKINKQMKRLGKIEF